MGIFQNLSTVTRRLRKKRVLFAWELGGGLGHVGPLRLVARTLGEALPDTAFFFALRNRPDEAALKRDFPGAKIYAAPVFRASHRGSPSRKSAYNYADMLSLCGYNDADTLSDMMVAWRGLFDDVRPDLIVCDHSPTVILAAAGRVPVVHFGIGFVIPPQGQPYLPLSPLASEGASERERVVLESIQTACRRLDAPVPASNYDILTWAENVPCCLPEVDPYRRVRQAPARGPVEKLPTPATGLPTEAVFGYLSSEDNRLPEILSSLAASGMRCDIFIRGGIGPYEKVVAGSQVKLLDEPSDLERALREAGGILHHGGAATTQVALAMGRPQFLLPRHGEQKLTTDALEEIECGTNLRRHSDPGAAIKRALGRHSQVASCAKMAEKIARRPLCAMDYLIKTSSRMLGRVCKMESGTS